MIKIFQVFKKSKTVTGNDDEKKLNHLKISKFVKFFRRENCNKYLSFERLAVLIEEFILLWMID